LTYPFSSFSIEIRNAKHLHIQQGRNQLFISGGAFFMNFHSMTSSCLFNHGTT